MLRIHVKLCQKIHCCFSENNYSHISELSSASGVPNACLVLVQVEVDCHLAIY